MMQLYAYNKCMKPNISQVYQKIPCFPPVKTVLGQLPPGKIGPKP